MIDRPTSEALADELALAAIRLTRTLRALNRSGKLTGPEISALAMIAYSGKVRARDLAAHEEVSAPAISALIRTMEAKGLVKRARDAGDGRVQWISATPKGARLIAVGHARRIAPLTTAIDALSPDERARIGEAIAVIDRLAAAVRNSSSRTQPTARRR
jgi:DNA-binding MarR family transcriptional regulator